MSIQFVDEALHYFAKFQFILGGEHGVEVGESILLASDQNRLQFIATMLDTILNEESVLPEPVVLGGLRALVDPSATMLSYSLFSERMDIKLRASVLEMMGNVFRIIFLKRCDTTLAHCAKNPISSWNLLCFMWWELLPRHGVPMVAYLEKIDLTVLETMGDLIDLDHVACKEAALHGLALWQVAYPEKVREIIDEHSGSIPHSLMNYAQKASLGDLA